MTRDGGLGHWPTAWLWRWRTRPYVIAWRLPWVAGRTRYEPPGRDPLGVWAGWRCFVGARVVGAGLSTTTSAAARGPVRSLRTSPRPANTPPDSTNTQTPGRAPTSAVGSGEPLPRTLRESERQHRSESNADDPRLTGSVTARAGGCRRPGSFRTGIGHGLSPDSYTISIRTHHTVGPTPCRTGPEDPSGWRDSPGPGTASWLVLRLPASNGVSSWVAHLGVRRCGSVRGRSWGGAATAGQLLFEPVMSPKRRAS